MSSYDVGHEISLLCAHILRLAGKSESDVGGVRIGIYGPRSWRSVSGRTRDFAIKLSFILKKGGVNVTFKQLFDDDAVANSLESLAGTLKAAKKKKLVDYGPELLLQVSQ